jgi:hypothetical protein
MHTVIDSGEAIEDAKAIAAGKPEHEVRAERAAKRGFGTKRLPQPQVTDPSGGFKRRL